MIKGLKKLHHVALSTPDLQRLVLFYRDAFGFEPYEEYSWEKGNTVVDQMIGLQDSAADSLMLKSGESCIELFEFKNPSPKPFDPNRTICDHGLTHFSFEVEDVQAAYDQLCKIGMRFHGPPISLGELGMVVYGRDPDGNIIELQGK